MVNYFLILITYNLNSTVSRQTKHPHYSKQSSNEKTTETVGHSFVEKYANIYKCDHQYFIRYLTLTPRFTTVRVNFKNYKPQELVESFGNQLIQRYGEAPEIYIHPHLNDCIVIGPLLKLSQSVVHHPVQIIVDQPCALAVLRGADVFAPGVLAMPLGIQVGAEVSVYADLSMKCLRGRTAPYTHEKALVASGVLKMSRFQLFANNKTQPRGVAVEITNVLSQVPNVALDSSMGILQNLPSILAGHYLDVQPGQKVLDMCAAPGNKLTHIALLMNDTGTLIALDKSKPRVTKLEETIKKLQLSSIQTHVYDSTRINTSSQIDIERMKLQKESFDRILLDAPCSGFGQRPMFYNANSFLNLDKKIKSYANIQKKLLQAGIPLLKKDGILVYCTCSLSVEENEAVIAWILHRHPEVELVQTLPQLGMKGLAHKDLEAEDQAVMQRFGPPLIPTDRNTDTIGFFICKLRKKY
ncbi:hypothetical protein M8J76_011679 [Diaphorina citri]|nr:hypothetical protein M8J75_007693 [Diaphorina citri]KAI5693054.1 hypothetical protein M8J75_006828 [Diaphorina citri]KAI5719540.1 hypothetical protein M8J76_011679 [Diaphorina citri]KAI5721334.1 hypothetical protein M8J77_019346 [Diaphorina citri]